MKSGLCLRQRRTTADLVICQTDKSLTASRGCPGVKTDHCPRTGGEISA